MQQNALTMRRSPSRGLLPLMCTALAGLTLAGLILRWYAQQAVSLPPLPLPKLAAAEVEAIRQLITLSAGEEIQAIRGSRTVTASLTNGTASYSASVKFSRGIKGWQVGTTEFYAQGAGTLPYYRFSVEGAVLRKDIPAIIAAIPTNGYGRIKSIRAIGDGVAVAETEQGLLRGPFFCLQMVRNGETWILGRVLNQGYR